MDKNDEVVFRMSRCMGNLYRRLLRYLACWTKRKLCVHFGLYEPVGFRNVVGGGRPKKCPRAWHLVGYRNSRDRLGQQTAQVKA